MADAAERYFVGFDECPVQRGAPCPCPIGHCPVCGYTRHDAIFNGDHERCGGEIPAPPMPAPPPPATDPQGWHPLVEGCAMPEDGSTVEVTVESYGTKRRVDIAEFFIFKAGAMFNVTRGGAFDGDGNPFTVSVVEIRLTAWRPAPAPYSGGVK